jgi:hypothetical protein
LKGEKYSGYKNSVIFILPSPGMAKKPFIIFTLSGWPGFTNFKKNLYEERIIIICMFDLLSCFRSPTFLESSDQRFRPKFRL